VAVFDYRSDKQKCEKYFTRRLNKDRLTAIKTTLSKILEQFKVDITALNINTY
jgi:very-short-patch-repair endonuclease